MPKCNTLFAYFTKSPKSVATSPAVGATPGKGLNNSTALPPESARSQNKRDKSKSTDGNPEFAVGDLVWAKLEGYPWWPSIVCNHPTEKVHVKKGKLSRVHVQFFDDPPSRAWVSEKAVKLFRISDKSVPFKSDPKWQSAFRDADKAQQLSREDRLALVVFQETSSNVEEQCEVMESDDEDDEAAADDDSIKENKKRKERATEPETEKKRRRILIASDSEDSDVEFKPDKKEMESDSESVSSGVEEISVSEPEDVVESPVKKRKITKSLKKAAPTKNAVKKTESFLNRSPPADTKSVAANVHEATKAKLAQFHLSDSVAKSPEAVNAGGKIWTHLTYDFLKEDKIRDANGRPRTHPDYDHKTLHIPDSFKKNLTPALKQWWEMKAKHFDVILFFKVGKFYELYHMDAVIGVQELNLVFMKGDHAHSGFPEIAYGRYSASLVERGYRVARIEQTETPQMMEERCKKLARPTKFDRVVQREICQITSIGTRRYGFLDTQSHETKPAYLMAIAEKYSESQSGFESEYGVCFVDTSIGKFYLGQFQDDRHSSRFQTLIAHHTPVQVLHEKGGLSVKTRQILKNNLNSAVINPLFANTEFWDANKTLKFLLEGGYFKPADQSQTVWPDILKEMLDENDSLGLTAKDCWTLALQALGACSWYLAECQLDQELLTMKSFAAYVPIDICASSQEKSSHWNYFQSRQNMILDSVTLKNLDILVNNSTGTLDGTLLGKLDHCCSAAGKRLLREWICSPLCNVAAINDRLDAIEDLIENHDVASKAKELLRKLPDLERLLSKIHAQGSRLRSQGHPDNRAIFFEDVVYSKRKIQDFISVLSGFKTGMEIVNLFRGVRFKSSLLKRCVTMATDDDPNCAGKFPDLGDALEFFDNAFNREKAQKDGKIIPVKGVDPAYDRAVESLKRTEGKLEDYLSDQCKIFGCKVTYVGTARNRYQLEVPDRAAHHVKPCHEFVGQRKGFKKYWTPEIKEMLNQILEAEDRRDASLRDVMRKIFARFSEDYQQWDRGIQCLAVLDVLLSLAHYSQCGGCTMMRPVAIIPDDGMTRPFLEIRDGHHPFITNVFAGGEFIPNDMIIGISNEETGGATDQSSIVIVTGPNMGGKSTLMRQVGLIVIIAQMGCYVPAETCRLTPVDRVFTRLGASDRILMGESTFFVELSETASILRHATLHSLVLMDELGRGTSTYDGMAIAYSVVKQLTKAVRCRTLFSTHYHSLVGSFQHNRNCSLGHMACLVDNENEDDPTQETITFLYKFVPGPCPKSYGFNAAKLAAISEDVVRLGHKKAKEMEDTFENCKLFRHINYSSELSKEKLCNLISAIKLVN